MRQFLIILGLTLLVWMGVSMSEERQYPVSVHIEMAGYDTIRYAVLEADTSLGLTATLSGFDAFLLCLQREAPSVQVNINEERSAVAVSSLYEPLRRAVKGASRVTSSVDSLHIVLSERACRTYQPNLAQVHFSFAEQYGLYGEPVITPREISLFGPTEVLDKIDELFVAPTDLYSIKESDHISLALEPIWQQYSDVHPSATEVDLYLPVEAYVEKEYSVPVQVIGLDTTVSLKLYPDQATVHVWVAQCDLQRDPDLAVAVNYSDVMRQGGRLQPALVSFSDYVRPRSIQPDIVQCVIIK